MRKLLLILPILLLSFACKFDNPEERTRPQIVVTTSILADGIRNLVGENADVVSLMPAGVDPHLYKASVRDLDLLQNADLVIYHGLFLEGKMTEIFEKLAFSKDLINVSETLSNDLLIRSGPEAHSVDPHIWFDVSLWSMAMEYASDEIIKWQPKWKSSVERNTEAYLNELADLHQDNLSKVAELRKTNQALITAHDAFSYFGKAYNLEVLGLQGLSTLSEPGLRDLTGLVSFIVERDIHAVFAEQTISPKAIEAVVAGCENQNHKIKLAGPLYTDSLGAPDSPAGTYIGMVKTNVQVIFESLTK
ncbi:manganese/zinc/iron transport system substrate-binding protein [Algoriphagus ratkowskyi]|uniref:Manganese/zinc/iron transport system substrate-binding protein n=1 Tax=Algoriphagus ratkowskyi TaxID=57028 RepID=A0A2W7RN88_9BACT|nr:zinc ABC transporter substrate-binding protein [Algoriphagus ratkowskyi]PZX56987.1 manganese/zinc/iron transport system substrate-binding protein [Algoriphagus ratkowskyi]TXD79893.1 metal ion ABC transporter substrate-binding protein [Algoriphagus ratkowskyi]